MGSNDLRPQLRILRWRSIRHWSAAYVLFRMRVLVRQWRNPDAPSITRDAAKLLEQLLSHRDRGVEWGSGNSTSWLAERTAHLTSFETSPEYHARVLDKLRASQLSNVDYRLIPFEDAESEEEMSRSEWVRSTSLFEDESLDYAFVDSSPRGCLCASVAPKLRRGGVLVLDNANWYLPPPKGFKPRAPGSVPVPLGFPGSRAPASTAWPLFLKQTKSWRRVWTSDGVQMTLIFIRT